jgi:hypothetical protein
MADDQYSFAARDLHRFIALFPNVKRLAFALTMLNTTPVTGVIFSRG